MVGFSVSLCGGSPRVVGCSVSLCGGSPRVVGFSSCGGSPCVVGLLVWFSFVWWVSSCGGLLGLLVVGLLAWCASLRVVGFWFTSRLLLVWFSVCGGLLLLRCGGLLLLRCGRLLLVFFAGVFQCQRQREPHHGAFREAHQGTLRGACGKEQGKRMPFQAGHGPSSHAAFDESTLGCSSPRCTETQTKAPWFWQTGRSLGIAAEFSFPNELAKVQKTQPTLKSSAHGWFWSWPKFSKRCAFGAGGTRCARLRTPQHCTVSCVVDHATSLQGFFSVWLDRAASSRNSMKTIDFS